MLNLDIFKDPRFVFNEELHRYTYDDDDYISATTLTGKFHIPFDTDRRSKEKAERLGVDQQVILDEWQAINDYSNFIGHSTHKWIENYYNKIIQDLPTNLDIIDRINKFNFLYAKHLHKLKPVAMELRIFSKKWKVAGTIDGIFELNGKYYIIDYKTNKKFVDDDNIILKKDLLWPFNKYYENHLNEYSIQITIYKEILKQYGIEIEAGFLVYIGPDRTKIYKCKDMGVELNEYFDSLAA